MTIETAGTLVACFATGAGADRAIAEAIALGLAPGRIGRMEDGHGPVLVSVMLGAAERGASVDALRRLGADPLLELAEARAAYRRIPHPGVDDRNGLKLPLAGEFPRSPVGATAPPRSAHGVLEPATRARSFLEIETGLSHQAALVEADRCVRCPEPPCQATCPAGNDIPSFIDLLAQGDLAASFGVLQRTNAFSAICGRVCDVERQCESACVLRRGGGEAVQIGRLERYVADMARDTLPPVERPMQDGPRVTVVGAGPAGLAAAGDLADAGCRVEVIEAMPVAGGAVAWGIPEFRLPQRVLAREIELLARRGVAFRFGRTLGIDVDLDTLAASAEAVVLAIGTQESVHASLPGHDLAGVWHAKDLLAAVKLGRLGVAGTTVPRVGPRAVVVGGGSTALDAAQTLLRLRNGSPMEVTIVYRRGEEHMPARRDEVEGARSEGVRIRPWSAPVAVLGDRGGRVTHARFITTHSASGKNGRRSPIVTIEGSEFDLPADTVVFALGYRADLASLAGVRATSTGLLSADARTGRTSRSNTWAVGDVVTGPRTVVHAMAAGRRAARDVLRALGRSAA